MPLLKFRIMYEDDDSIFRDVEIKPANSFADLEAAIISSYNMPPAGSGTFYMSNDNWQKGKQLHPTVKKEEKKKQAKAKAQTQPSLVAYIDDPHQHFIYQFQSTQEFSFLIELITIGGTLNDSITYPTVVKSQGASPFKKEEFTSHTSKKKNVMVNFEATEDEEEVEEEEDVETEEEAPAFVASADQADAEDLATIEGEEGEEEGDLMEGDAIKEDVEEEEVEAADDIFASGDDFNPDDLSESISEDLEEDL